ncbi:MAG: FAD-dependent oxidoreductase, partial [Anaerolineae bacterium]|nr:FAD-dependent oxidoreductase [Anaerolineae bacterium]
FADNVFSVQDRHLPGMWRVGEGIGGGNVGHTFGVDGTSERSLTAALLWGRKSLSEYEVYYKHYLEGFEDASLVATGALLGLRETRRILGDYVLALDDFNTRAIFEDEIGRYNYPVDIHASTPSSEDFAKFTEEFRQLRYKDGESYGIPYRVLTPLGLDNVLVAGRCVSSDRFMQGSIRVMPGCYITGQAAGVAASIAASRETDVHAIDVKQLQAKLKTMGAYLPNAQ